MPDFVKRWFVLEYDGKVEKRQLDCYLVADHKVYVVKMGCFRETVAESKCYDTEALADARIAELEAEPKASV
jgi:hypothetical protein